ncbi:MAG: AraC family transcriptional regulator ligand-binding domain-containing protein [Myxococcota bacterium]
MSSSPSELVHVGSAWRMLLHDVGVDEIAVLRRAGLPSETFRGDGTRISLDDFFALHEAVEEEAGDPEIPLRAGKAVSVELFDPALFSAICSPDMNTAARRLGQFKRTVGAFTLDVEVGDRVTVLHYRCKARPELPRGHGLTELVFLVAFARRATRHEIVPHRITVQRAPDDTTPYADYFGCAVEVGDGWRVSFEARDTQRPFLTHNARMWEAFEPGLRRRMSEADEARTMRAQVEAALFELLPSGRTRLTDLATEVGVGSRTLQRRLAAEGTSWLEMLNKTRERLARYYLANTEMSPTEVSFLLGFEDANSLFRAFNRWTGTTPESWRSQARGG